MRATLASILLVLVVCVSQTRAAERVLAEVKAWEGTLEIPTYAWEEDINPKFWALEGGAKLSTTIRGAVVYPYVMQDHLLREKTLRTYKALFLENEYLKVTCLPELGGRLHSVWDKTTGEEMFHFNEVIKPGMIAMRGAWISGGVEWNSGPHGHTVTVLSPVDALIGHRQDGSAYLEISNQEKIFRTRWTVRVTLHPGRAYLDEQIRIANPTDGMHPYYFWNCTAFPNRPGTRFIYPMSLGTDHNAEEFFNWPVHEGRDLTWLKNYETYASIFAVDCPYDFFGAYEVDANRGIVQVANRHQLSGKKAWTWGEWEFGKVAQRNLTDDGVPYIEVQSGPLPTQSDYGMLAPREHVQWQEWWYPVHGLGDGFEFASKDLAAQAIRKDQKLELRLLATGRFPNAVCTLTNSDQHELLTATVDLSPAAPVTVALDETPQGPIAVTVTSQGGQVIAAFTTPLPIAKTEPPARAGAPKTPDDELTVDQLYLKGRKHDRATDRRAARKYYELALARDPMHVLSLRALAVLDCESGLYDAARERLELALVRDRDDGLSCYYLGVCYLRQNDPKNALHWGYQATRCFGAVSIGYDLVGRAQMVLGNAPAAVEMFRRAVHANSEDVVAIDHLMLALYATGKQQAAVGLAERRIAKDPTALVPRALIGLLDDAALERFARETRSFIGEDDFELLEASLVFAELKLFDEAGRVVQAACVQAVPPATRNFLPLYYLAWFAAQRGDESAARELLTAAAAASSERQFASRVQELEILRFATERRPEDSQAHLQLGCLLANLGRIDGAVSAWQSAVDANSASSIAWRNLGLAAASNDDLERAESCYRQALAARPDDQTLYRDLAEILVAGDRRQEAVELLEKMPPTKHQRAEITMLLAQSYVALERYDDCVKLLESMPYFVNWEGQDVTWRLFNRAHVERGRLRLDNGDVDAALADFEAALTYPENLNVGRSNKPQEASAQYWRGKALQLLGRVEQARAAFQQGADGADVAGQQNEFRQKCREELDASK